MNLLGVVTARGGSKGIPGKNLKRIAGQPLIWHTLQSAVAAGVFHRLIVSTDDPAIADYVRAQGCEVPFMRPVALAQDDTPHLPVLQHTVRWLEEQEGYRPDAVMILQPTSPLRRPEDIAKAIQLLESSGADSVLSVSAVSSHVHPLRMLRVGEDGTAVLFVNGEPVRARVNRRQDLPPAWVMNGAIYLFRTAVLDGAEPSLYGDRTVAMHVPPPYDLSLDDLEDWEAAECALAAGNASGVVASLSEQRRLMDLEQQRDLKLLEAVEQDSRVTQRNLASQLGIALGLANVYLRRLVRKGYIKATNIQPNRLSYLITPSGIAEKARLTYEFMDYSLHLYKEVRQHLRETLQECAASGQAVAIYGRGEAAELAYLSLKESGLEPAAIFDFERGQRFLGMPVLPIADHATVRYDLLIIASLDRDGRLIDDLVRVGVPREKLFPLRREPGGPRRSAVAAVRFPSSARTR